MSGYVGRLAPSPTGALHLGNVRTFMIAWLRARSLGGKLIMRMEDLDHPKDKPGAAAAAIEDLKWLEGEDSATHKHACSGYRLLIIQISTNLVALLNHVAFRPCTQAWS